LGILGGEGLWRENFGFLGEWEMRSDEK